MLLFFKSTKYENIILCLFLFDVVVVGVVFVNVVVVAVVVVVFVVAVVSKPEKFLAGFFLRPTVRLFTVYFKIRHVMGGLIMTY